MSDGIAGRRARCRRSLWAAQFHRVRRGAL